MPPKKTAPSVAMESGGSSESWVQTQGNQQNIGADMFLAYIKEASPELSAEWGVKWSEVPENCTPARRKSSRTWPRTW